MVHLCDQPYKVLEYRCVLMNVTVKVLLQCSVECWHSKKNETFFVLLVSTMKERYTT